MPNTRRNIPKDVQLKIWHRDGWLCRYCGEPIFFAPALQQLDQMNPGHGYYHPNGRHGSMLELLAKRWASIDHVHPHARGGEDSEDNYVSACWECNNRMGDRPRKLPPLRRPDSDWDGLSSIYPQLIMNSSDPWLGLLQKRL